MNETRCARPRFAYVGCFTSEKRKARGRGVAVFRIDPSSGAWTHVDACQPLHNPHYVCLDGTQRFLYSAHGDASEVWSYAIDAQSGRLTPLNCQPTGGDNSSTVAVHASNRYLVVSTGPGVAVYPINADGSLAPRADLVVPAGEPGPWRREQHGPHPHQATFDLTGRYVVVPDKGLDKIFVFRLDAERGKLVACDPPFTKARYGAIPRHITFHPHAPYAYVINEQDSTVNAYHWDTARGELTPFQRVPTTPTSYVGDNTGAEIAITPSGKFVYASNRGHDTIAIFAVDQANGSVEPVGWESTQGRKPRFFGPDPDWRHLYACNEDGHTIVEFAVDHASGRLTPTGQIIETGSPTCIAFKTN
ncbi:MAG TPA: lactonase family protein [Burkholderiales bacterium]|nr:lactonase family protein [Burkholderiales bacterium]